MWKPLRLPPLAATATALRPIRPTSRRRSINRMQTLRVCRQRPRPALLPPFRTSRSNWCWTTFRFTMCWKRSCWSRVPPLNTRLKITRWFFRSNLPARNSRRSRCACFKWTQTRFMKVCKMCPRHFWQLPAAAPAAATMAAAATAVAMAAATAAATAAAIMAATAATEAVAAAPRCH